MSKDLGSQIIGFAILFWIFYWIAKRRKKKDASSTSLPRIPSPRVQAKPEDRMAIISSSANDAPSISAVGEQKINQISESAKTISMDNVISSSQNFIPDLTAPHIKSYWVKSGEPFKIQGVEVNSGLFYAFSRELSSRQDWKYMEYMSYMVDPDLPISSDSSNESEYAYFYFNRYSDLTLFQRYKYVQWLATGRTVPIEEAYLKYFLKGLEQRVLGEISVCSSSELEEIVLELERIHNAYHLQSDFRKVILDFIVFVRAKFLHERPLLFSQRDVYNNYFENEYPLDLKFTLAEYANSKKALPASIALFWVACGESFYYTTSYNACRDDYERLYKQWYSKKFGDGIILSANKRAISYTYKPQNNQLRYSGKEVLQYVDKNVPDITYQASILKKLSPMGEIDFSLLDKYASFVYNNPDKKNTLWAYSRYPSELWEESHHEYLHRSTQWITELFSQNEFVILPQQQLLEKLEISPSLKLTKREVVGIIDFLSKAQVGIEPDIRFSSIRLSEAEFVALFRQSANAETTSTSAFSLAQLFLHLAVTLSQADGTVSDYEKTYVKEWINTLADFSESERRRLMAHLEWLLVDTPKLGNMKKKLQSLGEEDKQLFARQLIGLVAIDGKVEPTEVTLLEKVYSWIGKDTSTLFSDIHEWQSDGAANLPITILRGSKANTDYKIPLQDLSEATSLTLNDKKVTEKWNDTTKVSGLLATVFADSEADAPVIHHAIISEDINGLDGSHSQLLRELSKQSIWTREEYEAICNSLELFPDGAMEALNTTAYDKANEALLDEDSDIIINQQVLKQLLPS